MTVVLSGELANRLSDYLEGENIKYLVENHRRIRSIFIHIDNRGTSHICDILSEFVISHHIKKRINSYLDTEFYFFDENEKQRVTDGVIMSLDKNKISHEIKAFVGEKGCIILDGFFKFRMREYIEYVLSRAEDIAYDITAEKEINEFANLLKYFVKIGDSVCDRVHVQKENNEYALTDDNGIPLLNMPSVMYEFSDLDHLPEDDLLSSLVSIAPKRIVIHKSAIGENDEDMHLLYKVFENSIEFCDGKCEKCREINDIPDSL